MMKLKVLDLFCGAGGAAQGYYEAFMAAGYDVDITGVDITPQQHYPFAFRLGDAMEWKLSNYDFVHASPVCKGYSAANHIQQREYPLHIASIRSRMRASGKPWVLENVVMTGKHRHEMPGALVLCGTMFALKVYRHRYFESSHLLFAPAHPHHPAALLDGYVCIGFQYGDVIRGRAQGNTGNHYLRYRTAIGRSAMGIDWMNRDELSQATPPAYTAWLGTQMVQVFQNQAHAKK